MPEKCLLVLGKTQEKNARLLMNMKIRAGTAQDLDCRNTLNNKHRESVFSFSTPCDFFHVSKQVDFHTGLAGACIVLASR